MEPRPRTAQLARQPLIAPGLCAVPGRHRRPQQRRPRTLRITQRCSLGASASPLLANVYLHYVFDLWARQWRNRQARGDVIIVRFADDIVVGFQDRSDAERFYADLVERFARFCLELNAGKTRLIEFGRFAAQNRRRRGLGRPETFSFLGFTHMCGKTRAGRFALRRKTIAKRMAAKLREVNALLTQRRHWPNQVELAVHVVTRVRGSGRWRPGSRRSGAAGTGSSSACA